MFTREDYIENRCTHRQYYGQFVTDRHKNLVISRFDAAELKEAFIKDEHLNLIRLVEWDNLTTIMINDSSNKALKDSGDYVTLCGRVCILKEAARQVVEAQT